MPRLPTRAFTSAIVAGDTTLSSVWPAGSMPRASSENCVSGAAFPPEVDLLDEQVAVLEAGSSAGASG